MATILNIETSTEVCSVSISFDGEVPKEYLKIYKPTKNENQKLAHSKLLAIFIDNLINPNKTKKIKPDAVAISSGPGSYTGLRIGTSLAKGFCFASEIPLISIDTMQIIAEMASKKIKKPFDYIISMLDARRMEVYSAIFDKNLNKINNTDAIIINENTFNNLIGEKIYYCGNGANKCKDTFKQKEFIFLDDIYPSAEYMGKISEKAYNNSDFADLIYFEPFYLKDFIATTPKKNYNMLNIKIL